MPLYLYRCECCEETTEAFNRIAERHSHAPFCGKNTTHGRMAIQLTPNIGYVQRECHYICPVTQKEVTTNRQRRNVMAEHNLIDANDFPPHKAVERETKKKAKRDEIAAGLNKPLLFH